MFDHFENSALSSAIAVPTMHDDRSRLPSRPSKPVRRLLTALADAERRNLSPQEAHRLLSDALRPLVKIAASGGAGRAGDEQQYDKNSLQLDQATWAVFARHLLPSRPRRGRKAVAPRSTLEGALWVASANAVWRDMPERYGNWNSVFRQFKRWEEQGLFTLIAQEAARLPQAEAKRIGHCLALLASLSRRGQQG